VTGLLWAGVGGIGTFVLMAAVGDMVSEEIRDRLDHLPHAILRLAALRLDPSERVLLYEDLWLPDLAYCLKGDEARPVTRLIDGTIYALGILFSARRSASYLQEGARASAAQGEAGHPSPAARLDSYAARTAAVTEWAKRSIRLLLLGMVVAFGIFAISDLMGSPLAGIAGEWACGVVVMYRVFAPTRRAFKRTVK
jgi:hypothetical protein